MKKTAKAKKATGTKKTLARVVGLKTDTGAKPIFNKRGEYIEHTRPKPRAWLTLVLANGHEFDVELAEIEDVRILAGASSERSREDRVDRKSEVRDQIIDVLSAGMLFPGEYLVVRSAARAGTRPVFYGGKEIARAVMKRSPRGSR